MAKNKSKLRAGDSNAARLDRALDGIEVLSQKSYLTPAEQSLLAFYKYIVSKADIDELVPKLMESDKTLSYADAWKQAKQMVS